MKCKKIKNTINAYLDNELGSLRAKNVQEHLRKCVNCSRMADEMREVNRIFQEVPDIRVADDFYENIVARISMYPARLPSKLPYPMSVMPKVLGLSGTAISVLGVFVVGLYMSISMFTGIHSSLQIRNNTVSSEFSVVVPSSVEGTFLSLSSETSGAERI